MSKHGPEVSVSVLGEQPRPPAGQRLRLRCLRIPERACWCHGCATHQSSFSLFPPLTFLQLCQHLRVHGEGPFHSHPSGKLPRPCCRPLAGLQGALVSVAHPSTCRAPGAPRDGSAVTEQLAANRRVTWCKEWGARPIPTAVPGAAGAPSARSGHRASASRLRTAHLVCTVGMLPGTLRPSRAVLCGKSSILKHSAN